MIPFCLDGYDPHLVAAILSYEDGIAVRSGSFCAQPYVRRLLANEQAGCEQGQQGLVRVSLGLSTSKAEVDQLVSALQAIAMCSRRTEVDSYYCLVCSWLPASLATMNKPERVYDIYLTM